MMPLWIDILVHYSCPPLSLQHCKFSTFMATKTPSNLSSIYYLLALLLSSGSIIQETEAKPLEQSVNISTHQKDVTTPMTRVPSAINPKTVDSGQDTPVMPPDQHPGAGAWPPKLHWTTPAAMEALTARPFNSYYQKNPIPTSCNFGGTAVMRVAVSASKNI